MELNVTFEETDSAFGASFEEVQVVTGAKINDDSISTKETWSSKNTVDKLCPSFTESGYVITSNPVEDYPLKVVSNIEPTQEGSGDPHPGSVSVVNDSNFKDDSIWTREEYEDHATYGCSIVASLSPGTYTLKYAFGNCEDVSMIMVYGDKGFPPYTTLVDGVSDKESTITFEITESFVGLYITIDTYSPIPADVNVYGYVLGKFAIYSGTDATEANIRPIVAHTAVNLNRCGKNLLNEDWKNFEKYTTNQNLVLSLPKGKYVLSAEKTDTTYFYFKKSTDGGTTFTDYARLHTNNTQTVNSVVFEVTGAEGEVWSLWTSTQKYLNAIKWVQIECGDVATSYEPYRGETITVELGQTVYGGSYNWTTGELTIGWKKITFNGMEKWNFYNSSSTITSGYFTTLSDKALGYKTSVCNQFKNTGSSDAFSGSKMRHGYLSDHLSLQNVYFDWGKKYESTESITAVNEFKAWLKAQHNAGTPVELCYKMAEPITVQFEPQEIVALQGVNTLFSNTGSTTVGSKVYPDVVIEKLTNAIIALGGNV